MSLKELRKFIVIFYTVGIVGFIFPFTKDFFITITPFALILSTYLLAIYHSSYSVKNVIVFVSIFLLGFTIEVVGVNTGLLFGNYSYGSALGIKFFDTPLLIGINWLFLTYVATSIVDSLKINKWIVVFVAPALMLVYDILLEQVAPKMDMWSWEGSIIPLKNYIEWYLFGFCFVAIIKIFKIDTQNPLSIIIFIAQFLFFVFLNLLL